MRIELSFKKRADIDILPKEHAIKENNKISKKTSAKRNTQNDNDPCDHKKKKQEPQLVGKVDQQEKKTASDIVEGDLGNGV